MERGSLLCGHYGVGQAGGKLCRVLHKGSPVFVEGRLNYQSWESDTGQKRNKLEVVASTIQFLGRPGDKGVGSDASGGEQFSSGGGDDIPF